MSNILVIGKDGQLGQSIKACVQTQSTDQTFMFVGRVELDLSSNEAINAFFADKRFDVIINCAAYTAVDKAEDDTELCQQINSKAVAELANIAKKQNAYFVHVSTDYVFNGKGYRPYTETDEVAPQNVYGQTKLQGELALNAVNPSGCIIRTSWVYSEFGNNFVKTMLRLGAERDQLGIIFDQVGTPTYAGDLAQTILAMVNQYLAGNAPSQMQVYHFSNEGVCSWYDFAKAIFELANIDVEVNPIETVAYPTPAVRPHYSVLNKNKIKAQLNCKIPYWKDSLELCLTRLKEQA